MTPQQRIETHIRFILNQDQQDILLADLIGWYQPLVASSLWN